MFFFFFFFFFFIRKLENANKEKLPNFRLKIRLELEEVRDHR